MPRLILHDVLSVKATETEGVFIVTIDATDTDGNRETVDFVSTPTDPYGLGPAVRQWMASHTFSIEPA